MRRIACGYSWRHGGLLQKVEEVCLIASIGGEGGSYKVRWWQSPLDTADLSLFTSFHEVEKDYRS